MPTGLREVAGRRIPLRPLPAEIVHLSSGLAALPDLPGGLALKHGADGLRCASALGSMTTHRPMHRQRLLHICGPPCAVPPQLSDRCLLYQLCIESMK